MIQRNISYWKRHHWKITRWLTRLRGVLYTYVLFQEMLQSLSVVQQAKLTLFSALAISSNCLMNSDIFCPYFTSIYLFNCLRHLCHIAVNMKLVHWSLMVWLLRLLQWSWIWVGCCNVPNVTAHPSGASVSTIIFPYTGSLLRDLCVYKRINWHCCMWISRWLLCLLQLDWQEA